MKGFDPALRPQSNWRGEAGLRLPFYKRAWFSALVALFLLGIVAVIGVYSVIMAPLRIEAEKFDLNELKKLEASSVIYDRDAEELARIYVLNRTPISIKDVPQHFIDALIAQEDSRFFQHDGVDYIGLTRAVWLNLRAGEVTQGASTITQQLARQTFQLMEKSYKRKILEAFLAQRLEKHFSKFEILEMYLNRIFFGANFYGVQAAARGYFGKDVKELTIEESATIVGLIKSPNNIQPLKNPVRAIKERNYVLERMVIEGTLTRDVAEKLKLKPMATAPQSANMRQSSIFDTVSSEVMNLLGEEKASIGGFKIYTSIDQRLQRQVETAITKHLAEVEKHPGYEHQTYDQYKTILNDYTTKLRKGEISPDTPRPRPEYLQGAALVMDNKDGSVLAMVGSRDFADSQFNRAMDGLRPAGTAFTPFVYAAAFSQRGVYPGSKVSAMPFDNRRVQIGGDGGWLGEWGTEEDSPKHIMADVSLREALIRGRNSPVMNLGEKVGLQAVKDTATRAGISSTLSEYQNLFLGSSECRLGDMCLAYSNFPTLGSRPQKLRVIQRITDAQDNVVFQIPDAEQAPVQSMDPIAAYQTHTCLVEALHTGTGSLAVTDYKLGDFPVAGKTGTHYDFKDLWFLGYTSSVTCGVWAGFDKQKTIYPGAFSSKVVLPAWTEIINAATASYPAVEIAPPEVAERVELCRQSGLRATDYCYEKVKGPDGIEKSVRNTYMEYVRAGTIIDGFCSTHTGDGLGMDIAAFTQSAALDAASPDASLIPEGAKWAHVEPVRMRGVTVIGVDPYNSAVATPKAAPVNEDGSPVKKAIPVDPGAEPEDAPPTLKLTPPPAMKIEL